MNPKRTYNAKNVFELGRWSKKAACLRTVRTRLCGTSLSFSFDERLLAGWAPEIARALKQDCTCAEAGFSNNAETCAGGSGLNVRGPVAN